MLLEVGLIHHIVHEACGVLHAGSICCRVRTVKGKVELEVRELLLDLCEVLEIEGLHEGACAIEEADLATGLEGLEELHDVAAERSHTGTTAHEDVLDIVRIVLRKEELSVWAADGNLVTRLACEDVRGGDTWVYRQKLRSEFARHAAVERRCGDADVELDDALLTRIRGH